MSLYGVLAEFASADALLAAARDSSAAGFRRIEAYAPFPVEGLAEAVGFRRNRMPLIVLLGGIAGGLGTYFMQWYAAVISYPINSGGRPLHSWPAFIPATFELTVLGAAIAGFVGMLVANGLPRLHHPLFDVPAFDLASRNRFFLCLRADQPDFEPGAATRYLQARNAMGVWEVKQ